jgi:hypothetical protein
MQYSCSILRISVLSGQTEYRIIKEEKKIRKEVNKCRNKILNKFKINKSNKDYKKSKGNL